MNTFYFKTIIHQPAYGSYMPKVTVKFYSKYKSFTCNQEDKLKEKGLMITGGSFKYFKNNPAFKVECTLYLFISAN